MNDDSTLWHKAHLVEISHRVGLGVRGASDHEHDDVLRPTWAAGEAAIGELEADHLVN